MLPGRSRSRQRDVCEHRNPQFRAHELDHSTFKPTLHDDADVSCY
jgi:hypothetical protein